MAFNLTNINLITEFAICVLKELSFYQFDYAE